MFQLARRGILRREEEGSRPDPLLARGRRRRSRQAHHHRRHAPDQRSKYRQDFIQELQLDSKGERIAITVVDHFSGFPPTILINILLQTWPHMSLSPAGGRIFRVRVSLRSPVGTRRGRHIDPP